MTQKRCVLTSIPCINYEAAVAEGGSMEQTLAFSFDLASVAHISLDDHYFERTVGDVTSILSNANLMLADLAGNK